MRQYEEPDPRAPIMGEITQPGIQQQLQEQHQRQQRQQLQQQKNQDGCCDNIGPRAQALLEKVPPCTCKYAGQVLRESKKEE